MTTPRMIELAAALIIFGVGVWLYRRRSAADGPDGYGSQGAVILFVVAVIMGAHALGAFDYRPSASEIEIAKERAQ
ncbi:MAG TPA: hypothetical protein VJM15_11495 [Sphingomicrobium sp.]|nr:hypothetical protein [Sphingomicrobium sp.]